MFTLYNLFKFLHVLAIIVWLGGLLIMVTLGVRVGRTRDAAVTRAFSDQGRFLGMALFGPAAAITLITGIGMVQVGGLSYGALWISWGMLGVVLSFVVGGAVAGAMAARLTKRLAAGEIDVATAAATQRRILQIGVLNLLVLVSVVFAMVFKPS